MCLILLASSSSITVLLKPVLLYLVLFVITRPGERILLLFVAGWPAARLSERILLFERRTGWKFLIVRLFVGFISIRVF